MTVPHLATVRAHHLIDGFSGVHVLVVGDVMLDRFVVGHVARISPEAPVPIVRFRSEYSRLGGAANVAHNLRTLGARVSLVGIIGADAAGRRLKGEIALAGIDTCCLVEDPSRVTVEKVRIVTERNQQVARIDYEDDRDVSGSVEEALIEQARLAGRAQAIVVSDYLKGTITERVVRALLAVQPDESPLLVDPKIPHLHCYAGATVITPNHHEAEAATHRQIRSDEDARVAAVEFRKLAHCDSVVITRGEHGMWVSEPGTEASIPAVAREVSDVTGAGDTVIASLALGLAAGGSLIEAACLANQAAGIAVGRFGTSPVHRDELAKAFVVA